MDTSMDHRWRELHLKAQTSWLLPKEYLEIIMSFQPAPPLPECPVLCGWASPMGATFATNPPASPPPTGSICVYDRTFMNKVKAKFKNDGHNWKLKKSGSSGGGSEATTTATTSTGRTRKEATAYAREDTVNLKLQLPCSAAAAAGGGGSGGGGGAGPCERLLLGAYAHHATNPHFHRRTYHMSTPPAAAAAAAAAVSVGTEGGATNSGSGGQATECGSKRFDDLHVVHYLDLPPPVPFSALGMPPHVKSSNKVKSQAATTLRDCRDGDDDEEGDAFLQGRQVSGNNDDECALDDVLLDTLLNHVMPQPLTTPANAAKMRDDAGAAGRHGNQSVAAAFDFCLLDNDHDHDEGVDEKNGRNMGGGHGGGGCGNEAASTFLTNTMSKGPDDDDGRSGLGGGVAGGSAVVDLSPEWADSGGGAKLVVVVQGNLANALRAGERLQCGFGVSRNCVRFGGGGGDGEANCEASRAEAEGCWVWVDAVSLGDQVLKCRVPPHAPGTVSVAVAAVSATAPAATNAASSSSSSSSRFSELSLARRLLAGPSHGDALFSFRSIWKGRQTPKTAGSLSSSSSSSSSHPFSGHQTVASQEASAALHASDFGALTAQRHDHHLPPPSSSNSTPSPPAAAVKRFNEESVTDSYWSAGTNANSGCGGAGESSSDRENKIRVVAKLEKVGGALGGYAFGAVAAAAAAAADVSQSTMQSEGTLSLSSDWSSSSSQRERGYNNAALRQQRQQQQQQQQQLTLTTGSSCLGDIPFTHAMVPPAGTSSSFPSEAAAAPGALTRHLGRGGESASGGGGMDDDDAVNNSSSSGNNGSSSSSSSRVSRDNSSSSELELLDDAALTKLGDGELEGVLEQMLMRVVKQMVSLAHGDAELQEELNAPDGNGLCLLHYASLYNLLPLVPQVLRCGAFVDCRCAGKGSASMELETPLHLAAGAGHAAVVEALVSFGADAALEDCKGQLAAQRAQQQGFHDIAAFLFAVLQMQTQQRQLQLQQQHQHQHQHQDQQHQQGYEQCSTTAFSSASTPVPTSPCGSVSTPGFFSAAGDGVLASPSPLPSPGSGGGLTQQNVAMLQQALSTLSLKDKCLIRTGVAAAQQQQQQQQQQQRQVSPEADGAGGGAGFFAAGAGGSSFFLACSLDDHDARGRSFDGFSHTSSEGGGGGGAGGGGNDVESEVASVLTESDAESLDVAMAMMGPEERVELEREALVIQKNMKSWIMRRNYKSMRESVRKIEDFWRERRGVGLLLGSIAEDMDHASGRLVRVASDEAAATTTATTALAFNDAGNNGVSFGGLGRSGSGGSLSPLLREGNNGSAASMHGGASDDDDDGGGGDGSGGVGMDLFESFENLMGREQELAGRKLQALSRGMLARRNFRRIKQQTLAMIVIHRTLLRRRQLQGSLPVPSSLSPTTPPALQASPSPPPAPVQLAGGPAPPALNSGKSAGFPWES